MKSILRFLDARPPSNHENKLACVPIIVIKNNCVHLKMNGLNGQPMRRYSPSCWSAACPASAACVPGYQVPVPKCQLPLAPRPSRVPVCRTRPRPGRAAAPLPLAGGHLQAEAARSRPWSVEPYPAWHASRWLLSCTRVVAVSPNPDTGRSVGLGAQRCHRAVSQEKPSWRPVCGIGRPSACMGHAV
jgi:hypothetical protein